MADAPPEWTWHPMGLAFLQPGLPLCPPPPPRARIWGPVLQGWISPPGADCRGWGEAGSGRRGRGHPSLGSRKTLPLFCWS